MHWLRSAAAHGCKAFVLVPFGVDGLWLLWTGVLLCMLSRGVRLLRCDQVCVAPSMAQASWLPVMAVLGCPGVCVLGCAQGVCWHAECTQMHACGRMQVLLLVGCWSDRVVGSVPPGSTVCSHGRLSAPGWLSGLVALVVMMQGHSVCTWPTTGCLSSLWDNPQMPLRVKKHYPLCSNC